MAPPTHKIDATLQAMERAHRATPSEQVVSFSSSIHGARVAFERFASADDAAAEANIPSTAPHSLLALVEAERSSENHLDRSLEEVKEALALMERKRMLALGALSRLSEEDAFQEVSKVKEHILGLSLRVPLRADFIVHGHNIGLSLFRLYEAAERAEGEVKALIDAKKALDDPDEDGLG
jgi:hypothetical protein